MKHFPLSGLTLMQGCGAVGKLPPLAGELPSASMTRVRNPLKTLCGQGQTEPRAGINPTLRM
ncbi:hypothetical protein GBA52_026805 [Prunus armeniaca]|nr:hypothetical protein GBA52_026805 [Prunus armeniaca]